MKVIVFGATGMVGQGVLRESLLARDVDRVLAVVRTPTGLRHPKLREVTPADFADLTPLAADRTHAVVVVDAWQWLLPGLAFLDAELVIHGPDEVRTAWRRFAARLRPG